MANIQSGPARVVDTGIATTFMGFPLQIDAKIDSYAFGVRLVFRSDPDVPDVHVDSAWDNSHLVLTCVNFDNAEGRGSSRPVLLGEADTDAVFFHFKVFRYGNTDDRTVQYTFFAANKDAIGLQPA